MRGKVLRKSYSAGDCDILSNYNLAATVQTNHHANKICLHHSLLTELALLACYRFGCAIYSGVKISDHLYIVCLWLYKYLHLNPLNLPPLFIDVHMFADL